MVTAKKNKEKKQKTKEEKTLKDLEKDICNKMRTGFTWSRRQISIAQLVQMVDDGIIEDPTYQRGKVWPNYKRKGVNETILEYGGGKIPLLTFRKIENDKLELVDGKQRLLSSIVPFVKGDLRLNGVYVKEFQNHNINDIQKESESIVASFLSSSIEVQIAEDMSYDDAISYFIQINNSGTPMTTGEQIHAMQGTLIMDIIQKLDNHPVWTKVLKKSRYNTYEYISRMIFYTLELEESNEVFNVYSSKKLINKLEGIADYSLPESIVNRIVDTLDLLNEVLEDEGFCVYIREFWDIFIYVDKYLEGVSGTKDKFKPFIKLLYTGIHQQSSGVCFEIKQKPNQQGYNYSPKYYLWYINNLNRLYGKYAEGVSWNEVQRLSLKG